MKITEWPKKATPSDYAKHWYTKPCKQTIVNRIKGGYLPGGQEYPGGPWYVWVNPDFTPATGYTQQNQSANDSANSAAAAIAARILASK